MAETTPSSQPQLLYSAACYYFPEGKRGVFSARPGTAYIYPGWILVQDTETSEEVNRVPIDKNLEVRHMVGSLLSRKNAQYPGPTPKLWLSFYKPSYMFVAIFVLVPVLVLQLPVLLEIVALAGVIGLMIAIIPSAIKKAKAFAAHIAADAASRAS